jgi:hypothetical protein
VGRRVSGLREAELAQITGLALFDVSLAVWGKLGRLKEALSDSFDLVGSINLTSCQSHVTVFSSCS